MEVYLINKQLGYRKYKYTVSMTFKKICKFIWWATEVALIIMIGLLMFTNVGHR